MTQHTRPAPADLDAAVAHLKQRLQTAQRARVRAEADRDAAAAAADNARAQLADEFGVHSVEEAKQMLRELETNLAGEMAAITEALDGMEV